MNNSKISDQWSKINTADKLISLKLWIIFTHSTLLFLHLLPNKDVHTRCSASWHFEMRPCTAFFSASTYSFWSSCTEWMERSSLTSSAIRSNPSNISVCTLLPRSSICTKTTASSLFSSSWNQSSIRTIQSHRNLMINLKPIYLS